MENLQSTWSVDPNHSKIQFKVKHLAIANVAGIFKSFSGQVQSQNESFDGASIVFDLDTNSIDTNLEERDNHLRSNLFLDAVTYPKLTFAGTLNKHGEGYEIKGDLTLKGITKPVSLLAEFNGTGPDKFNNTRAGFEATGTLNRKDFGINISILNDIGSLVIADEVKLIFDVELIKVAGK